MDPGVPDTLAAADAKLFSTTLLARDRGPPDDVEGAEFPPDEMGRELLPRTISESVFGPSSTEVWL